MIVMAPGKSAATSGAPNTHCCVVELDGLGVLVLGQSGSGKTSLCHGLIERFSALGRQAIWVADDQAYLETVNGRLLARVPAAIAGKAELYGHGIIDVDHKSETRIGLVVIMTADEDVERMPIQETFEAAADLPLVRVPIRHEAQAVRLVTAALKNITTRTSDAAKSP